MTTSGKKFKSKKTEREDDSVLSKNHSKSVKFRLRVQQEEEANNEIQLYKEARYDDEDYRKD